MQETSSIREIALKNMNQRIGKNPYPGRGIVVGLDQTGTKFIQIYWIMGRSENSRNRVFVLENNDVKTNPFDHSKVTDPSLIIYTAMKTVGDYHIVSNGTQTDAIAEGLSAGIPFESTLLQWQHEPDGPVFTPRISAVLEMAGVHNVLKIARINKSPFGDAASYHSFYHFDRFAAGLGVCLHTYETNGNPPPPFTEDPYPVLLQGTLEHIAAEYWNALNKENKVGLATKAIDVNTGEIEYKIINTLKAD